MRGKQNGIRNKEEDKSSLERGVAEVHRKGKEL
jgi:hypothetical protein